MGGEFAVGDDQGRAALLGEPVRIWKRYDNNVEGLEARGSLRAHKLSKAFSSASPDHSVKAANGSSASLTGALSSSTPSWVRR